MKIAFIYDAAYPWVTGGAEKRVYELAKRLAENGHEVHCYSFGWWWSEEKNDIVKDGIHLHGVSKPQKLYTDGKRSIKEAIYFSLKLINPLMKENFDVVDCQGFPFFSSFTARIHSLLGKSTLFITWIEVWDDYWYEYMGKKGVFGKLIERTAMNLNSNWIAISDKVKRDLIKINSKKEISVVPMGIDAIEIQKIKPSRMNTDVIFAGRLIKNKNVDLLIRSIALVKTKIPDVKCLIIGDGPEKDSLLKLREDMGLTANITFMDFLDDHDDLISSMKSSKVFVLPSTREGFGIVVIEANACGLPVVVVRDKMNAACDLIYEGLNGYISDFNHEDMADRIFKAITNKEEMNSECLKKAVQFDWNKIIPELEGFYSASIRKD
jgi:L-malate glycosyltransferase